MNQKLDEPRSRTLKPWHAMRVRPKHKVVASLSAAGLTGKEISDITGYSESRVSVILNDPRLQAFIVELSKRATDFVPDVRERLEALSNEALDNVAEIMRGSGDDAVSLRASFGILDRAGYSRVDKKIIAHAELTEKAASIMAEAMRESDIIDVDYEIEEEDDEE